MSPLYDLRRRHSILGLLAAVIVVSLLLQLSASTKNSNNDPSSFLLNNNNNPSNAVTITREDLITPTPKDRGLRKKCQIVYLMGVESGRFPHHGLLPVIESFAQRQIDPLSKLKYTVTSNSHPLKAGLFGWFHARNRQWGFHVTPALNDPALVKRVVQEICPNDGRRHVLIEWTSFPSGHEDDKRRYRVHKQHEWLEMSPEEIANSDEALQHPTNMTAFLQAYSPYVDIKFVVVHRPFIETIASHNEWNGGPEVHSNVIRGFMLMLRRFLDAHPFDLINGKRLWTLLCIDRIMGKNYNNRKEVNVARQNVLANLANFLGWPVRDCPRCFDGWKESRKNPLKVLGPEASAVMREHMKFLEGVWPPPGEEGVEEQQCEV